MKTKLLITSLLSFYFYLLSSQVPQGLNYQALAGDASGNPIRNTDLQVKISILSDTIVPVTVWEELHPAIKTNAHGIFSLVVGKGSRQAASTVTNFSDISWSATPLYLKTQIYYQSSWKSMGSAKLWTVPYSMVAGDLSGALKKLSVTGNTSSMDEALFEVKNKNGQTVFAVYNEGVRIYVDDGSKGAKGGFSIGGFDMTKGSGSQQYLYVGGDSIRAYIYDNPLIKSAKGGFAIGGYDMTKGPRPKDLLTVSDDSIRMYIDNNGKGAKGGFAIGGFDMTKGTTGHYLDVSTDATGIINPSENRILWYPIKNSFLAGKVLIEDPDSVGENSMAIGYESKAKGQFSQAMGFKAIARGDYATAIGKNAVANRINSFALGEDAQAKDDESYAFGRGAIAEGFRSFAFGSAGIDSAGQVTGVAYAKGNYSFALGHAEATGIASFALGTDNKATNDFSQAFGLSTLSSGHTSTTFGFKTIANNWTAMAIGQETIASGGSSFSSGNGSIASGWASEAFGNHSVASGDLSFATGNGTKATGSDAFASGNGTLASGPISTAFGCCKTEALGFASLAMGGGTFASGDYSFAGGGGSKATNVNTFSFGYLTLASGDNSVAIGNQTRATGGSSVALGASTIAGAHWAVAFGNVSQANGYASLAGGWYCNATGHHSFAFGSSNLATDNGSVAFGDETKATSGDAFSIGYRTRANGWGSAVFGNGTIANSYATVVMGRFNDTTAMSNKDWFVDTDAALIIGNGTSNTDRKNALTVLQNSNVGINMVNPQYKLDIAGGSARIESGYSWLTSSDIRYKKNITSLENSLDEVMAMRGVRFDLINDNSDAESSGRYIGFIAQELEKVVPEVVVTGADGYKSVAYDKLTAVLTEAIKEQQHKIESQQKEIDDLKALVNRIIANSSR